MRTILLFWLTFALAIFDANAVLDSQGTRRTITKLTPQIKTSPSAIEKVNQIDIGDSNKSSNDNNHQIEHTRKHKNKMQLVMNDQQQPRPTVKVLRTPNSFESNPDFLGVAKRRFMRRGEQTTPAQQPNSIMDLASTNLLVVDSSRHTNANPDQKSKKAAGQRPGIPNSLFDTQAVKLGDPNDAQQTIIQGGKPSVVELALGSDTLITATPPGNVPGPVKLSPPP